MMVGVMVPSMVAPDAVRRKAVYMLCRTCSSRYLTAALGVLHTVVDLLVALRLRFMQRAFKKSLDEQ